MLRGVFRTKDNRLITAGLGIVAIGFIIAFAFLTQAKGSQYMEQAVMAENYLKAGDYEQAAAAYTKAMSMKNSDQGLLSIGLSEAYVGMDDYDKALEVLRSCYQKTSGINIKEKIEEVISKKTEYEYLQSITRADIYFTNQEYDKAILEYEKAKLIKSKEIISYQKIAEAYLEKGEFALAREEALEGQALTQSDEFKDTLELVDSYILKKQYEDMVEQAAEYIFHENYEDGIAKYKEAIVLMPGEAAAFKGLGETYLIQERYEDAVMLLQAVAITMRDQELKDLYDKAYELKSSEDEREDFLKSLYMALEKNEPTKVVKLMESDLFEELVASETPIYYESEAGELSKGYGMIIDEDGSIYLGAIKDSVKKGIGTYFLRTENKQGAGYYYYYGEWNNDIPNGNGETVEELKVLDENNMPYSIKIITEGIYYNATENDVMNKYFYVNGFESGRITYTTRKGIPQPYINPDEKPIPTPEAETYVIAMIYQEGVPTGTYYSVEPQTYWGVKPFLKVDKSSWKVN